MYHILCQVIFYAKTAHIECVREPSGEAGVGAQTLHSSKLPGGAAAAVWGPCTE